LVPSEASLTYWQERLTTFDVTYTNEITTYAGRKALHLEDPDGLRLVLLVANSEKLPFWEQWENSDVPMEHQILGMGPVEMTVRRLEKLTNTLTELFGYTEALHTDDGVVYQSIAGEVFGEIVAKQADGKTEKPGRG